MSAIVKYYLGMDVDFLKTYLNDLQMLYLLNDLTKTLKNCLITLLKLLKLFIDFNIS